MAQQVSSYRAKFASRGYIFYEADGTTGGVQYEAGTVIALPANYAQRMTNSRYPTTGPIAGWINYVYVDEVTPVYTTTTDKCTPPDTLEINVATKVLSIKGGGGGDLNTFTAFGISWRERSLDTSEFGAWSAETTTTARTVGVSVNEGKVRQYRVRTQGSAGEAFYSDWKTCETLLSGVRADAPIILLPVNGKETCSRTPVILLDLGKREATDEGAFVVQRKIDDGDWADLSNGPMADGYLGAEKWDRRPDKLPAQEDGDHTVAYRLRDATAGTTSEEASVSFVVNAAVWKRTISAGDIISNAEISHQADIREMLEKVNQQRAFYGMEPITLEGTIGLFADWNKQMNQLLGGCEAYKKQIGLAVIRTYIGEVWPTASVINLIRERVTEA